MPVIPSLHWNITHEQEAGEVFQDLKEPQIMRTRKRNKAWLFDKIHKDATPYPEAEPAIRSNFSR